MIEGIDLTVDEVAVVVTAASPLNVVSTAPVGGGVALARALVNLHVMKNFPWQDLDARIAAFGRARGLPAPYVGLFTAAWTEKAEVAWEASDVVTALAVSTVGLRHPVTAGAEEAMVAVTKPSTINTLVVVDATPGPAALVNLIATVTEVKASVLAQAGLRAPCGALATGTSTDAVAVAATGRGLGFCFGGPVSELGCVVARAARRTLERGVARWLEENR